METQDLLDAFKSIDVSKVRAKISQFIKLQSKLRKAFNDYLDEIVTTPDDCMNDWTNASIYLEHTIETLRLIYLALHKKDIDFLSSVFIVKMINDASKSLLISRNYLYQVKIKINIQTYDAMRKDVLKSFANDNDFMELADDEYCEAVDIDWLIGKLWGKELIEVCYKFFRDPFK